jgi:hypothetical protein
MTTTTINNLNLHNATFLKGLSSASFIVGSSSATSISVSQTNHGFSVGQAVYFNGSIYQLGNANSAASSEIIGLVSAIQDASDFTIATSGQITGLTGLTPGTVYFLSDSVAGSLQATDVTNPGHISLPLFVATSTTGGVFYKQRGVVVAFPGSALSAFLPGRNRFINGEPAIAQRGAGGSATFTFSATSGYAHDRWQCKAGTGTSMTVSQTQLSNGVWAAVVNRTSGNTGTGLIQWTQSMTRDQCKDMAGRQVTKSFKAASNSGFTSAGSTLNVKVVSGTGADLSHLTTGFTGATTLYNSTVTLNSSLQSFVVTVTVPSNATQLYFELSFNGVGTAPANDGFTVTDQQSELGGVVSPFERKTSNQTLLDCLAFYQKSYPYNVAPATAGSVNSPGYMQVLFVNTTANSVYCTLQFPFSLRATPSTVQIYSVITGSAGVVDYFGSGGTFTANGTTPAIYLQGPNGFGLINRTGGTYGTNNGVFYWIADAELY